jgi:zinc protease
MLEASMALAASTCRYVQTVRPDGLTFWARGPVDRLEELLERAACRATTLRLDGPRFDRRKERLVDVLEHSPPEPWRLAQDALLAGLFPGSDDARSPTAEDVKAVTPDDVKHWLARGMRPDRALFILSGDVTPGRELDRLIKRYLGRWEASGPLVEAPRGQPLPAGRTVAIVPRAGASAELLVGVRAPDRRERDVPAFDTLAWMMEDDLTERLRVAEGATYGVSVTSYTSDGGDALLLDTMVDAPKAGHALSTLLDRLGKVAEAPPFPALVRARSEVAHEFSARTGTAARNARLVEAAFVDGRQPESWASYVDDAWAMSPDQLQETAAQLAVGREAIVVLGDPAVIRPQLEALGLTPKVVGVTTK